MMSLREGIRVDGSGWRNKPRRNKDEYPKRQKRGDKFYISAVFHKTSTLDDLAVRTKIFMERESAMDWGY